MADLKQSEKTLRRWKLLLFFLFLIVFTLASLVRLSALPAPEESAIPFSMGILLDGTFFEKNDVWGDLLQRDILYENQTPPQLLLIGGQSVQVEAGSTFTEPGFFAQDARGNELTQQVQVWSEGDRVIYEVTDELGNSTRLSRTITYVDTTPPDIRLTGNTEMHLMVGETYTEPGYTARDSADGILTEQVEVSGTVDEQTPGTYLLEYTVRDSAGNKATQQRTVYVDSEEDHPEEETPEGYE